MIFQQKLLKKAYFIFKLTGRAMVRPSSPDKWKAPLVNPFTANRACERRRISGRRFSRLCSQAMLIRAKVKNNNRIGTPFGILSADAKVGMTNNLAINQSRRERVTVPL